MMEIRRICFFLFLENIYLAFSNLFLGFYIFVSDIYSFFVHLLIYLFINCLIYLSSYLSLFNFSFRYFKNIFLIQFINIFYLLSVYIIIVSIEAPDAFKLSFALSTCSRSKHVNFNFSCRNRNT